MDTTEDTAEDTNEEPTRDQLAQLIRRTIIAVLLDATGREPRPLLEKLDEVLGAAALAQEVVVRLGLADPHHTGPNRS